MTTLDDTYLVLESSIFEKTRKKMCANLQKALNLKIQLLAKAPYTNSLNTKPLNVSSQKLKQLECDSVFEFRINDGFRCIFYVRESKKQIILAYCGNHDGVKKHLK